MKKKVIVGMSGGVDSSVAAYLLKEQGYDVIGVTMNIWQNEDIRTDAKGSGCCGLLAVEDARRVAWQLDIPYYVMNFKEEFQKNVIEYFVDEYRRGHTPNPCIACNRYVKWEALLQRSLKIGADYIATGHYAGIEQLDNGRYAVRNCAAAQKDQTYALYSLTQEQLKHTLMPLGDYAKNEVRSIARQIGIKTADKPDSQDICFVDNNDYAGFIKNSVYCEKCAGAMLPGNFVNLQGEVIGRHKGYLHYTIGQRKGLNLAMGYPVFVVDIRPAANEVVIGRNEDCFSDRLTARNLNFMAEECLEGEKRLTAKIRYAHKGAECTVRMLENDCMECIFDEPQRAITKGQAVVLYEDGHIFGGGTID